MRAQISKKVAQKEKEQKEKGLREFAQKAREERQGIRTSVSFGIKRVAKKSQIYILRYCYCFFLTDDFDTEAREREQLRYDRHKERERERRIAKAGAERRRGEKTSQGELVIVSIF